MLQVKRKSQHQRKEQKRIKDIFASNIASKKDIDEKEIFGNPIYERLIGNYESINKKFDGKFHAVITDLKNTFGNKPTI